MKRLILILIVTTGCLLYKPAAAQVAVNVNIGSQPAWGPVGYDYVEYYYIPDVEVYYYVPTRRFVYLNNGDWIFVSSLPYRYRSYNLYTGYKVVINGPKPYLQFTTHKVKFAKFKGNNGKQVIIKNSNDPKYYVVKGHPKYNGGGNKKVVATKSTGNKKVVSTSSKSNTTAKANASKNNSSASKSSGGGKGKGKN